MSTQPIINQRCDLCGGILAHNANKTEYTCIRCGAIVYKQITSSDMQTVVKQRPALFSTPMVRSEREGRKGMTRRIVKSGVPLGDWEETLRHCPYGKPGDILWVREEHYRFGHWGAVPGIRTKQGRQKWAFIADTSEVLYFDNPPSEFKKGRHHKDPATPAWHKRLARFMPKNLCRTYLQIIDIWVERLQDISEEDAIAEGVEPIGYDKKTCRVFRYRNYPIDQGYQWDAKRSFQSLWENINGPGSWEANPWVWAISFKRIDKPE